MNSMSITMHELFLKRKSSSSLGNEDGRFETFMTLYAGFVCMYACTMFMLYFICPMIFSKKLGKATH
jgi:hypothetical protein